MESIRVIELPKCNMVSSGCSTDENPFAEGGLLMSFDKWWSAIDAQREDKFFPRDFMWYDSEKNGLVWYYAATPIPTDTEGFEVIDFPGGLYAAAVSRDGDYTDGTRVRDSIQAWILNSTGFEYDDQRGHSELFHVITPETAAKALGYSQLEIYVPIRPRA